MNKSLMRGVALTAALLVTVSGAPGEAKTTAPKVKPYNISNRVIFNTPAGGGGTRAQQNAFSDMAVRVFDATPGGQAIRISTFGLDIPAVGDALIRAKQRGVAVQISVWRERAYTAVGLKLRAALGTNVNARSYYKVCVGSCRRSGTAGVNHAKVTAISAIKSTNGKLTGRIVFSGSANYTAGNTRYSWNNMFVHVGNRALYDGVVRYVIENRLDRDTATLHWVASGGNRMVFYPQKDRKYDPVLADLNKTSCKTGKGFGVGGRTVVRVMMFNWTNSRKPIADRLGKLKRSGCDVRVIVNGSTVTGSLITSMIRAGIPVYNGLIDSNRNGVFDTYQHGKTTVIDGRVAGRDSHRTWSGSQNFTGPAIFNNTEQQLLTDTAGVAHGHEAWFDRMAPRYSPRIWKAPTYPKLSAKSVDESGMYDDEPVEVDR